MERNEIEAAFFSRQPFVRHVLHELWTALHNDPNIDSVHINSLNSRLRKSFQERPFPLSESLQALKEVGLTRRLTNLPKRSQHGRWSLTPWAVDSIESELCKLRAQHTTTPAEAILDQLACANLINRTDIPVSLSMKRPNESMSVKGGPSRKSRHNSPADPSIVTRSRNTRRTPGTARRQSQGRRSPPEAGGSLQPRADTWSYLSSELISPHTVDGSSPVHRAERKTQGQIATLQIANEALSEQLKQKDILIEDLEAKLLESIGRNEAERQDNQSQMQSTHSTSYHQPVRNSEEPVIYEITRRQLERYRAQNFALTARVDELVQHVQESDAAKIVLEGNASRLAQEYSNLKAQAEMLSGQLQRSESINAIWKTRTEAQKQKAVEIISSIGESEEEDP
ncbi:uncharacterized protein MELLADRAFT_58453 [Melampsora larici-populina 98AG31]|uniref:Uncharacterized protein n=1 Tax=Melampsora larici-populina (strain 98AG31 / pathotype 3-4-7) TaxID=747676 RepID=F4R3K3_MELLP|nr:uncharacterized protein MELLADRAFT_58453 [Melampsora larici-populina 98AG31]EGG12642.1 hypothetical protein MELLADRAFT_58453 [Melampsora larici-populina 98AG31]